MNRKLSIAAALAAAAVIAAGSAFAAAERASAKEAETMVKKGVALIKAGPKEQALAEISRKNGPFVDRDLYLVVYRTDGMNMAHGVNPKMIGKNLMDMKDIDGKEYMRERMELAAKKPAGFWHDLKFVDPLTKKIEPKEMYCERLDDLVVCGGVYKPL
ncbi:MAG TPA: cache domain-containing protein [Ramlibacter sp.]|nr:cache domain-containing protein [Ramlibacter sp.]